jgi:hypothetical protein
MGTVLGILEHTDHSDQAESGDHRLGVGRCGCVSVVRSIFPSFIDISTALTIFTTQRRKGVIALGNGHADIEKLQEVLMDPRQNFDPISHSLRPTLILSVLHRRQTPPFPRVPLQLCW